MIRRLLPGLLLLTAGLAWAFPEGSDPAHTGFDGQPDCGSCHYAGPDPGPHSGLFIKGLPAAIEAGAEIEFRLHLRDPEALIGGFQLLIVGGSESAGQLHPGPGQQRVAHEGHDYLGHAQPTAFEATDDGMGQLLEWTIRWTAPDRPGSLAIHASAVAADDDRSSLGDNAYTVTRSVEIRHY